MRGDTSYRSYTSYTLYIIISILAMSGLTSCAHKELCEIHPHVRTIRVVFDWRDAPAAAPEGMCVFFYPEDGGAPQRFDFAGRDGGEIELSDGSYRVLFYNNDTEAVLFRNTDSYNSHAGYTREGTLFESIYGNATQHAPRASGTEEQPVVISPDMMWGGSAPEVVISDNGISCIGACPESVRTGGHDHTVHSEQVITLYPHEQICTYTYEVRNVRHLKHITQVCGSLSGMSGAMTFSTEELDGRSVTIPFGAESDGVSSITGGFYTFGHHEDNAAPHHMTFYIWMDDGKKYAYGIDAGDKFNVTDQIHSAPDKRHVHIIIDGLDLPQPIENGNGFDISVDDWDVIEEDIDL